MSVLIKGMQMPENCRYCPMRHGDIKGIFTCLAEYHVIKIREGMRRPAWCPLVEIPEETGRMMKMSEWKVLTNYVAGLKVYQVYRIIDESQPMHSGNIEVKALIDTEEEAQRLADWMNEKEKKGREDT